MLKSCPPSSIAEQGLASVGSWMTDTLSFLQIKTASQEAGSVEEENKQDSGCDSFLFQERSWVLQVFLLFPPPYCASSNENTVMTTYMGDQSFTAFPRRSRAQSTDVKAEK